MVQKKKRSSTISDVPTLYRVCRPMTSWMGDTPTKTPSRDGPALQVFYYNRDIRGTSPRVFGAISSVAE